MNKALSKANLNFKEINYINAHGTSTPANDKAETLAIKNVFNEHAYNLKINSTKSIIGILLVLQGNGSNSYAQNLLKSKEFMAQLTIMYLIQNVT